MKIWAIADLHLSFGTPNKSMAVFGAVWKDFEKKIETHWKERIADDDLVLIAGDISWALHLDQVAADLEWIHRLPGKKVLIRGNHDYWWPSLKKLNEILPPSLFAIQNNALCFENVAIAGTRLWDTPEFSYHSLVAFKDNPLAKPKEELDDEKIFLRELERLSLSLKAMPKNALHRIAMLHYPPIGPSHQSSRVSQILEAAQIDVCVFGHLHNIKKGSDLSAKIGRTRYYCVAADYLDFTPVEVFDTKNVAL